MQLTDVEIVKMSGKGQLVVPQDVRDAANLSPGQRFAAFPVQDGVVFKKVEMPKVKLDFEALSKEIEAQFKKNSVKKKELKGALEWARKK